ncbi:sulfatase-like hydrolase/transferase [Fodinisporobacter ferrooxydans]|uniref:Sulfatase-like hydrolase/transferase n=1 Tax=Fodinisporobacter ferrooxydans TaxID=2901836 RepID=A0ABY4CE46_9BACL|nr:sulfatase-like hydrolase/transferase [Alicyclobacillaceae bacterium MYW30-H2]
MNQTRPNILLITTDQQHHNTIHALGNEAIQTPNLDRLAKEGVAFRRAYTANPVCSPSRSSILTGEYPSRHGCWNIGVALDKNRPTLSQTLSNKGYSTALFGKAHFQPVLKRGSFEAPPHIHDREFWKSWKGPYYGFEQVKMVHGHSDEDSSHGMHYGAWLADQGIDPAKYFGPGGGYREGSWDLPEDLHYTRWSADQTIEFMRSHVNHTDHYENEPFFAWCSFQDPHNAFLAPEPWASMYDPEKLPSFLEREGEMLDKTRLHQCLIDNRLHELDVEMTTDPGHATRGIQCLGITTNKIGFERARRWLATYYGMISLIDFHIGRVLKTLDNLGLADNTIVIFTSDHGDYAGNHGIWLKGPLHYEDVIRIPFLVRWPDKIPSNMQTDCLMSLVDLVPTLLEACGLPDSSTTQGVSQLQTWFNPKTSSRDWCLVENRAEPTFYVKTMVTDRYKLNYFLDRNEGELYDLYNDPNEFINLYNKTEYTDIRISLLMKLIDVYGQLENQYPSRQSFA